MRNASVILAASVTGAFAVIASLTIALTIQQQDVAAFNDNNNQGVANNHDHFQIGSLEGNGGIVTNSKLTHSNENTNTHRDDQTKTNSFIKPGNDK
jgi:hypothetical protein